MGKISKSEDEWRQIIEEQFRVTRKHGTEPPFSGGLYDTRDAGIYLCVCCGEALFDSLTKFDPVCCPAFTHRWTMLPSKKLKMAFSCGVPRCMRCPDASWPCV